MTKAFSTQAADGHVVHGSIVRADNESAAALLVHGITSDRHEWGLFDLLSSELASRGITSVAIDYRGHGESVLTTESLSLSGVLLDIEAGWNYLTDHVTTARSMILGNSFGGGCAFLFGGMNSTVYATIATCPVLSYINDLTRTNPHWKEQTTSRLLTYSSKSLPSSIVPEMFAFDSLIRMVPNPSNSAIFHGTLDSDVPFSESERFVAQRGAVQLEGLEGMDHSFSAPEGSPQRDKQSLKFRQQAAERIAAFMARIS